MKANSLLKGVFYTLFVCGLIAALVFLIFKTQGVNVQSRRDMQNVLDQIKQSNSDWNVSILRSAQGLASDYDPLTAQVGQVQEFEQQFLTLYKDADAVKDLTAQLNSKAELVDSFKSQNSVLRNSLRYIPTAYDELHELYDSLSVNLKKNLFEVDQKSQQVLLLLLRYNLFPDGSTKRDIESELRSLKALSGLARDPDFFAHIEEADAGKDFLTRIAMFSSHAGTILNQRDTVDALLLEIQAVPVVPSIDKLHEKIETFTAEGLAEADEYRSYLSVYSVMLLLLVFYFAIRLIKSYRQISVANRLLSNANETLEQRVLERTVELKRAMDNLKQSEATLVQSEKMASLGQMVAGVAHEINTPLAYVKSTLETVESNVILSPLKDFLVNAEQLIQLMRSDDATESEITGFFAQSTEALDQLGDVSCSDLLSEVGQLVQDGLYGTDQIKELVLNLKNFSRMDRSKATLYDIEKAIDSSLMIAKHETRTRTIIKKYQHVPPVLCAPSQINQVFLNIITNAVHATQEHEGTITISTYQPDKEHIAISIADNGKGIEPGALKKIFDPFFTTKEIGKGTGLGLSITYKIIEQHGGNITADSKVGLGTRFIITLPINRSDQSGGERQLLSA